MIYAVLALCLACAIAGAGIACHLMQPLIDDAFAKPNKKEN